jgi:hypothetical protein
VVQVLPAGPGRPAVFEQRSGSAVVCQGGDICLGKFTIVDGGAVELTPGPPAPSSPGPPERVRQGVYSDPVGSLLPLVAPVPTQPAEDSGEVVRQYREEIDGQTYDVTVTLEDPGLPVGEDAAGMFADDGPPAAAGLGLAEDLTLGTTLWTADALDLDDASSRSPPRTCPSTSRRCLPD